MSGAGPVHSGRLEGGRVLELALDAGKGNVLSGAVMAALEEALLAGTRDPATRLVLLRSAQKHFSFGASVPEHQADQAADMLAGFHRLIRAIGRSPVPVAACVGGQCLGGAFEVVLACHFVFASERATLACPEIKLGVFPPVLAALGPARLGAAWTERLVLTGAPLDLQAAHASGFVTELVAPGDDPTEAALAFYREHLAPLSAFSLRQSVRACRMGAGVYEALGEPLDRIEQLYLEQLLPSHDGNEGITAFLERRPAAWQDR